ncbi:hypothetical protein [Polluticoccus soli]|uniref:hypothetical protein n=1 Tax=Polluticoccus soli TaxID=3034150 RepID=UPI0023E2D6A1|nr:hypothetical protein [Flavipsychrobacter sp. JY13-12]
MSIIDQLATSLGRKDEVPNQELAQKIAAKKDKKAVDELVANLVNKSKDIQSDCIKVLYEIGTIDPLLIAPHYEAFIKLLNSKNNRLVWGAMTALDAMTDAAPKEVFANLSAIMDAADKGSVITKDHSIGILIKLAGHKAYADDCTTLLLDQLKNSLPNQLPMYAENALPAIGTKYKEQFWKILESRLDDMEKESKRKRIEKVLKKIK